MGVTQPPDWEVPEHGRPGGRTDGQAGGAAGGRIDGQAGEAAGGRTDGQAGEAADGLADTAVYGPQEWWHDQAAPRPRGRHARRRPRARPGSLFTSTLIGVCSVAGTWLVVSAVQDPPGPGQPAAAAAVGRGATPPGPAPLPSSPAARITIPSIGVNAPVTNVGLDKDGWVQAPSGADSNLAGWFVDSAPPGSNGTAVLDGRVDTRNGPGVFFRLGALKKGHRIEVTLLQGAHEETAVFLVGG